MTEYVKSLKDYDLRAEDLEPYTFVKRTFKGKTHTVFILDTPPSTKHKNKKWWRYFYNGKLYKTLSAIVTEITGDRTLSGNVFFRLRRRSYARRSTGWTHEF